MAVLAGELVADVERLAGSEIRRTPGVCGGVACVRQTRIPVWLLIAFQRGGSGEAELLANHPSLTFADMDAVWAYYRRHTVEVDADIVAETVAEEAGDPTYAGDGTGGPAVGSDEHLARIRRAEAEGDEAFLDRELARLQPTAASLRDGVRPSPTAVEWPGEDLEALFGPDIASAKPE